MPIPTVLEELTQQVKVLSVLALLRDAKQVEKG
jgi:hypothetical protein